ncbi:hypothetical protein CL621_05010 [archaeon]|nr:hypothetical protein [archaeon]|tara:strand:- start:1018 stop:2124 length:1107 start_codon:yes stop_codon:yes gene_type:complete
MIKLNVDEYSDILKVCFNTKDPLYMSGPPGIGKSAVPIQVYTDIAEKQGKEFVCWDKTTKAEKITLFKNPDKYFVFCDQRLSQMDTTDLRGIPKLEGNILEPLPPSWVVYFSNPKAEGVIFFDEVNLAPPIVQGSAYQIINDRSISDRKISDKVHIIAAGNRAEDKAYTFEMPLPLRDRFSEAELYPDVDRWTEWASSNEVSPHLIAFIQWKNSYLYRLSENDADKSTTPRGIVRASRLLGKEDITSARANTLVSIATGEAFATEFQAYCKYFKQLDWDTIFADPESVKGYEVNTMFAVAGGLSEKFLADYKLFDKIIPVISNMPEEFAVMSLRLMKNGNPVGFKRRATKSKQFFKDLAHLGKFIEVE